MSTTTLEAMQNEVIREILNIDNLHVLEKVKKMLRRSEQKAESTAPTVVSEDAELYMTKTEILEGMAEAFKTAELAREGKVQGRPIEELLNVL